MHGHIPRIPRKLGIRTQHWALLGEHVLGYSYFSSPYFFLGMKVKNPSSDSSEQSELFPLNPWGFFFPLFSPGAGNGEGGEAGIVWF